MTSNHMPCFHIQRFSTTYFHVQVFHFRLSFVLFRTPVKRGRGRPPKHPKTPSKTPSPPVLTPQTKVEFSRTKPISASSPPPVESDVKDDVKKEEREEEEEEPTRRITRRLSCSSLNNPSSTDGESKRQRSESGSRSVKTRSGSVTSEGSSSGHPTSRPGLRHSSRLSSSHGSTSAPPEITREIPLPSPRERRQPEQDTEKTLPKDKPKHKGKPDNTKDKPSVQNTDKGSENGKQNGNGKVNSTSTNQNGVKKPTTAGDKNTFTCKLLPEDANYAGRRPPVSIYGAQHLLRLFGKF